MTLSKREVRATRLADARLAYYVTDSLRPRPDALTFLKHEGLLTKVLGKRRRTEAEPEAEAE